MTARAGVEVDGTVRAGKAGLNAPLGQEGAHRRGINKRWYLVFMTSPPC